MRSIRVVLFVVALVHGAFYALVMPPWQAPDEVAHFEYSHLLAALRRPISSADDSIPLEQAIIQSLYQFHTWTYGNGKPPPVQVPTRLDQTLFGYSRTLDRLSLTYVVYALASWPFLGQDLVVQLYAMRLASAVMGALVVLLAFETARLVSPGQLGLAFAVGGFVLCLPQHAFITASVSDGNLAELAASACIFLIVRLWRRGLSWLPAVMGAACAIVAMTSKATAYFLVGLILIAGPALVLRWRARRSAEPAWAWRRVAWVGLVMGGFGAVLIPIILFLPRVQFIGFMLGKNATRLDDLVFQVLTLNTAGRFSAALWGTFTSFWVTFGWMRLSFPQPVYVVLLGMTLLSVGGLARHVHRLPMSAEPEKSSYALLALASVLAMAVLIAWFLFSPVGLNYSQGRYLFGAIVPISILLVGGWMALAPPRFQPQAALLFLVIMMLFDAAAIFNLAWPFFYRAGLIW